MRWESRCSRSSGISVHVHRNPHKAHLRQLHPFLGEHALNEIRMDALQPFIRHRRDADGVSNASVNRALEIVRRILHLARDEWDWIESFPRIRMLREPKRRVRFLTRQEADALLEALPAHLRPVVTFALATGCRMGEILDLEGRGSISTDASPGWSTA